MLEKRCFVVSCIMNNQSPIYLERTTMDWPTVSILIVTYDRPDEIRRTIYALLKNLKYPRDKLLWHLADDSSPGHYLNEVKSEFKYLNFSNTVTDRKGWGANVNKALIYCQEKSDYVFNVEDDYVSLSTVDLERGVSLLMSKEDKHRPEQASKREPIGLVRYDGIAAHWLKLDLRESDTEIGSVHYMRILPGSVHLNCYSNRPHLKHRRFHDFYGMYPEGIKLGECETAFAHRVRQKMKDGPWLCVLEDGITKAFEHIGKSRQNSELDVGAK